MVKTKACITPLGFRIPIILVGWFQVHLLNITSEYGHSVITWAIYPAGSGDYISHAAARVSISGISSSPYSGYYNFSLDYFILSTEYTCWHSWTSCESSSYVWELSGVWLEYWAPCRTVYTFNYCLPFFSIVNCC